MGHCKRRGYCCQDILLAESPDTLRTAYEFWKKTKSIDPNFSEIYLIYPMLVFKFEKSDEDLPYHYRCKHFTRDENGVPACSIHPIRPGMCRDFPYYEGVDHLDRSGPLSPYEGCGYNDPD
ncbi:MAG: YkgJ family cysteine cluster protein [Spirochaetes bacterium]|jgi:Fe-S-cluster containining protein|nr:YkgJ family cysteine cluster protein [Spirochaetota bacterium]